MGMNITEKQMKDCARKWACNFRNDTHPTDEYKALISIIGSYQAYCENELLPANIDARMARALKNYLQAWYGVYDAMEDYGLLPANATPTDEQWGTLYKLSDELAAGVAIITQMVDNNAGNATYTEKARENLQHAAVAIIKDYRQRQ